MLMLFCVYDSYVRKPDTTCIYVCNYVKVTHSFTRFVEYLGFLVGLLSMFRVSKFVHCPTLSDLLELVGIS